MTYKSNVYGAGYNPLQAFSGTLAEKTKKTSKNPNEKLILGEYNSLVFERQAGKKMREILKKRRQNENIMGFGFAQQGGDGAEKNEKSDYRNFVQEEDDLTEHLREEQKGQKAEKVQTRFSFKHSALDEFRRDRGHAQKAKRFYRERVPKKYNFMHKVQEYYRAGASKPEKSRFSDGPGRVKGKNNLDFKSRQRILDEEDAGQRKKKSDRSVDGQGKVRKMLRNNLPSYKLR